MYEVNVLSIVLLCKQVIPGMIAQGGGAIVNVASGTAHIGEPTRNAYGTTKAAVVGLTRNIAAAHIRQGVRCNAVSPGLIASPTVVAKAAAFASLEARTALSNDD